MKRDQQFASIRRTYGGGRNTAERGRGLTWLVS